MSYLYKCSAMGCEDKQSKFCGFAYRCPFCGEGMMELKDDWVESTEIKKKQASLKGPK